MKKVLAFLISFVAAFSVMATDIDYKTSDLTVSAGTTPANYNSGSEITQYFTYTTPSAIATNKVIALAKVPAYSRILDCEITTEAHGGSQTFEVGLIGADDTGYYTGTTADDTDFFLSAFAVTNAVNDTFASFSAGDSNAGYQTTKDVYVVIRTDGAALATNKTVEGVVRFLR